MPNQVNVSKREYLDEVETEIGEVGNIFDPFCSLRVAEARVIGREHIEAVGKRVEDRGPGRKSIGPVQIKERRALSAAGKAELAAPDIDRSSGKRHCGW